MESKLVLALEPLFLLFPISRTPPLLPDPTFAHLPPPFIQVFVQVPCPQERPDFTYLASTLYPDGQLCFQEFVAIWHDAA